MKIVTISDAHLYLDDSEIAKKSRRLDKLEKSIPEGDVLITAGDMACSFDEVLYHEIFEKLGYFKGLKLCVPGNHDLWTDSFDPFGSIKNYKKFGKLAQQYDWHMLDVDPVCLNDVGFVGNIGWYDYSFKSEDPELSHLTDEFYSNKKYNGGEWNDRNYIKWLFSDKEFLDYCVRKMEKDIKKIQNQVGQIVVVTHHLPFKEAVVLKDRQFNFFNAFMGSTRIGDLIDRYEKIKTVIYGHNHKSRQFRHKNVHCYESGKKDGFLEIDI